MKYYQNLEIENISYFDDDGNSQIEEWKDIPDYFGKYQASILGRIKSLSRFINNGNSGYFSKEKILRSNIDIDGYLLVSLCKDAVAKKLKRHRIIAQVFIPNPLNLPEVNHMKVNENGESDKSDNRVSNLEWSTGEDNRKHANINGLLSRGEKHSSSKLTEKEVLEIRASNLSHNELALMYSTTRSNITKIMNRYRWKHI